MDGDARMILYFSGTGNSEYVAGKIAAQIKDTLYSIRESIHKEERPEHFSGDRFIFVTPTYAWRIPKLVEAWIRKADFQAGAKAYFLLTCGSDTGNAGKYLKRLCVDMNLEYMGMMTVVMPENYIAMFRAPGEQESIQIIHKAEPVVKQAAASIEAGEKFSEEKISVIDRLKSGIVNDAFYPLFVKTDKFRAEDSCIGCGKCAAVCPLHNIKIVDGKPIWGKACTHCMSCICDCPMGAVEYGKASVGQERYHCPM